MRKVLTKHFIPAEWPEGTNSANYHQQKPKPGTGCYSTEFDTPGYFLDFILQYEEVGDGMGGRRPAQYEAMAILREDGKVDIVNTTLVKFVMPDRTTSSVPNWFLLLLIAMSSLGAAYLVNLITG